MIGIAPAPKDDPISSGHVKAKKAGPDIDTDYEGWLSDRLDKIAHAADGGWLETYFNDEIQPHEKAIFPPDFQDLVIAFGRRQTALSAEE